MACRTDWIRFLRRVVCETSCVRSATTRRRVSVSSSGIHTSGRNPLAWSFASTAASILSVFTFAQAIARTRIGLAMTTRSTKGESNRTIELVLPVASITISSSSFSFLANCNKRLRSRSTFPASRSFPFSRMAVLANDRWTSRAMILIPGSFQVQQPWEPAGDTTTTDPRSQRNRASRRGRPDNNSSSQLIRYYGLPAIRAPDTPIPVGRW